jgi:hypothetical protein
MNRDNINPNHYKQGKIEAILAIESSMTPEQFKGYLKGNIFKYCWRFEDKGGIEDLKKAQWYINRLIDTIGAQTEDFARPHSTLASTESFSKL